MTAGEKYMKEIVPARNKTGWQNKSGTGGRKCPCGSWENHWNKFSGKKFEEQNCANEKCSSKAEHGSHVYNTNFSGAKEWIVPFCAKCNLAEEGKTFTLRDDTIIVNANVGETCGKT